MFGDLFVRGGISAVNGDQVSVTGGDDAFRNRAPVGDSARTDHPPFDAFIHKAIFAFDVSSRRDEMTIAQPFKVG